MNVNFRKRTEKKWSRGMYQRNNRGKKSQIWRAQHIIIESCHAVSGYLYSHLLSLSSAKGSRRESDLIET